LVLHNDPAGNRSFHLQLLRDEGHRRARATESACHLAAMAFEEGARLAAEKLLRPALGWHGTSRAVDRLEPTYTEIRNFLVGELDAHYLIACRVAADRVARFNKYRYTDDERYVAGGERGWL
jgi:hypothetical protein